MASTEECVIAIELGALNARVAVFKDGASGPEVIANESGGRCTPCCVCFTADEEVIGDAARSLALKNPKNTVTTAARFLGLKFADSLVKEASKGPVKMEEGPDGGIVYCVESKEKPIKISPVEIVTMILKDLRTTAENAVGATVKKAVMVVPASFSDDQKAAAKAAAKAAKLEIVYFMDSGTATAISLGYDKPTPEDSAEKLLLIVDVGASTEISLVSVLGGLVTVKGHARAEGVGGRAVDEKLFDHFAKDFKRKSKAEITYTGSPKSAGKLLNRCEDVKHTLSNTTTATMAVESLHEGMDYDSKLNRGRLEMLAGPVLKAVLKPITEVLEAAGVTKEQVTEVIMVGGTSRMPKLQTLVKEATGKDPKVTDTPDETPICGGAIQGALLAPIVNNAETMEKALSGKVRCAPRGLGVQVGDKFFAAVPRGAPLPAVGTLIAGAGEDNQASVLVEVHEEGEDNGAPTKLAHLVVPLPANTSKDKARVEVKFKADAAGALVVEGRVLGSKEAPVSVSIDAA